MKITDAMVTELINRWENEALFESDRGKTETLRACADTLRMLQSAPETTPSLQPFEDPRYKPCPQCNSNGAYKYSPHEDCICGGIGFMIPINYRPST